MVVDVHSHMYPEAYLELLSRHGDSAPMRAVRLGDGRWGWEGGGAASPVDPTFYDPVTRLQEMDAMGIDTQAVSLTNPGLYWADGRLGEELARAVNDSLAELARAHPGRFVPVASLPLQDPEAARRELDRAVNHLGFRAVFWGSHVRGRPPDHPSFRPVLEAANAMGVLVMVHPIRSTVDPRLYEYHLDNLVGFPFENTLAAARALFSGIFVRYPAVKWYFTHLGGAVPFLRGRWRRGQQAFASLRPDPAAGTRDPWSNVYFDTVCFDDDILRFGLQWPGPSKLLFGTDYPFEMRDPEGPARLHRVVPGGPDREGILWRNAATLLGL